MSRFLVDTNVFCEILRAQPDRKVVAWSRESAKEDLFVSVISIGELRKGLTVVPPSARRAQLEHLISVQLSAWFGGRILPVTRAIAERWGVLDGQRQLAGRPLNVPDGQIAATALEHDLIVATRNVKDFQDLGVPLVNPWES